MRMEHGDDCDMTKQQSPEKIWAPDTSLSHEVKGSGQGGQPGKIASKTYWVPLLITLVLSMSEGHFLQLVVSDHCQLEVSATCLRDLLQRVTS